MSKARSLFTIAVLVAFTAAGPLWASPAQAGGDRYVPPVSSPIFNEPPQITTEIRPIYLYNWIPGSFVTGGGYISLFAVQLRAAITERLAFIATKDGYADIHFDAVLPDEEGLANVAAGLKYALVADSEKGDYLSAGFRYEAPLGHLETAGINMQGDGDGFVDVFLTGSTMLGERSGLQASAGFDLPLDDDNDSALFHASLHTDCEVKPGLFALVELNLVSTIDEGTRTDAGAVGSFEGFDIVNFGNNDSGTVTTLAFGARYRISDNLYAGLAWEVPVSSREDIIDQRLTTDAVIVF
ncbi:MAG: hypothetical protein ACE5E4_08950 [Candidatus Binatia bacterium]